MLNQPKLYVELIHSVSGLYPSWEPSQHIQVGDYGTINKSTGSFDREGTIYDPKFEPDVKITEFHSPVTYPEATDLQVIASHGAKPLGIDINTLDKLLNFKDGKMVGNWTFTTDRAAIVAMYKPTITRIKQCPQLLERIKHNPLLVNKVLVTSVYNAPMFAMLLTDQNAKGTEAVLALALDRPQPTEGAPVADADETKKDRLRWLTKSTRGVWVTGDEGIFYPLFELHTMHKRHVWERLFTQPDNQH